MGKSTNGPESLAAMFRIKQPIMKRARLLQLVQKAGVRFEESDWYMLLWAPAGFRFCATDAHCIVAPYANHGGQSWKPEAYARIAEDLAAGLEACACCDCTEE